MDLASEDIIVAKQADVILVWTGKNGQETNLHASSLILGQASTVFYKMFNGDFAEKQLLPADGLPRIPLPVDDTQGMEVLCKMTHLTFRQGIDTKVNQLVKLVKLCDKYDCCSAVSQSCRGMAEAKRLTSVEPNTLCKLVFITYVLDLPTDFYASTVKLLFCCASEFDIDFKDYGTTTFSGSVILGT
jgi:hypothetical protein